MDKKKLANKIGANKMEIDPIKEAIKKAIQKKFGTVKRYADLKGISEASMSERISNHSTNAMYGFEQDGIIIDSSFNRGDNSPGDSNIGDGIELAKLQAQIELLKEQLKEKDARIIELERKR